MNKNVELATALSYIKNQLKVSLTDALASTTKEVGMETTADNWNKIRFAIESAVDITINDSHNAFNSLLK